ncbi:MAG: GatB/YqeY domain-containing protein [Neisseriaceae bacterium]|nr:GatB/YqeY domain-containing protein [Neisseriaceae bacterium]MBP6860786.1 GatB/YqeY domain-containing protein [Neisseriaceae bacterium]
MTTLKAQINEDMKSAMRAKDTLKLSTVRLLLAAIKQQEVDTREDVSDDSVLSIVTKMVKQRKDSAKIYQDANRQDLADKELAEITILEAYLPEALSNDAIAALISAAIAESQAEGMKDMGKVMAIIKPKVVGQADMGEVSRLIKAALN